MTDQHQGMTEADQHLVWISGVSWDGIRGTDWHLGTAMTRYARILWVDPPVSPMTPAAQRHTASRAPRARLSVVDDRITRLTPVALPGLTRPVVRATTTPLVRRQVAWAVRRLGIQPFGVVVTHFEDFLGYWGPDVVNVLYGTDDFVAGGELMRLPARRVRRLERRALTRADIVAAVSPGLTERWTSLGASPAFIPNGCRLATVATKQAAGDLASLPPPVVGLVGQISDRIDFTVIKAVVRAGFSLVIVGPLDRQIDRRQVSELTGQPNVRYVGPVPADSVPAYLAAIDIGITPYTDSPFNQASFPLKTLEYLGAGIPVVSADMAAARWLHADLAREAGTGAVPEVLTLASGPSDFVAAIRRIAASRDSRGTTERCTAFAARHTWTRRADAFAYLIGLRQEKPPGWPWHVRLRPARFSGRAGKKATHTRTDSPYDHQAPAPRFDFTGFVVSGSPRSLCLSTDAPGHHRGTPHRGQGRRLNSCYRTSWWRAALMSAAEFIAVIRRRWYVLGLVMLCTLGAVWRVHERPIAYQGCEVLKAAGPTWSANLNTYGALTRVAAMVTQTMLSQPVQARLAARGVTDYTVEQSNIGDIRFPTYADELRFQAASYPAAIVCSTSSTPQTVRSQLAIVTSDFRAALRDMQVKEHVSQNSMITAQELTSAVPVPIVGQPLKAYLGVILLGLISAVALTLWTDPLLRRLSSGRGALRPTSTGLDAGLANSNGSPKGIGHEPR